MNVNLHFHIANVNVTLPEQPEVINKLNEIGAQLNSIISKLNIMADKFDVLTTEVTDLGTVVDSAVTLLDSIADQIADAKDDPAQIQTIVDSLRAKKSALAAAIAKNTQAEGETPANGENGTGDQPTV